MYESQAAVFDLETTYAKHLGRAGSPFSDGSIKLCSAVFDVAGEIEDHYFVEERADGVLRGVDRLSTGWFTSFPDLSGVDVLVGHNIKFDLLWYWRHPRLEEFLKRGGKIWDTLYAEYLLSGQFFSIDQLPHLRPSLGNVAKRRGCTHKLDIVAAMWEDGYRTEDIPEDVLIEYNKGDVETTRELYVKQIEQAIRQNQMHTIEPRMDGLLATTEMEFNGLQIDLVEAEKRTAELEEETRELSEQLDTHLPWLPEECTFNWNSTAHLSALLFGGDVKYKAPTIVRDDNGDPCYYQRKVRREILLNGKPVAFKSGKNKGKKKTKIFTEPDLDRGPKTRIEEHRHELPRQTQPSSRWQSATVGQWSTAAEVLDELGKRDIPLVEDLLALRGVEKDLGTYYKRFHRGKWTGMLTMVGDDRRIHHNLNHAVTKTARLSSSKPNLQNLSGTGKSQVRKMFISRFTDGVVAEGDYSQLEVVCKGVLSRDLNLLKALIDGVCFHCDWLSLSPLGMGKTYDEIFQLCKVDHVPEWVAKRKQIKPLTFGEAYGAGVTSLCQSTGMSADQVESAIKARKQKYPDMYQYDADNIYKVKDSRRPSQIRTAEGYQAGIGYLRTCTDTIYHFLEGDSPDWMKKQGTMTSFSPTTIKNYPSQGLGGEVMQVALGRLFRWNLENDRFNDEMLLVNTVHDCVWFDLREKHVQQLAHAQYIMQDVCPYFNKHYPNVNWATPFPAEFEVGKNMYVLEHLEHEEV